MENSSLVWYLLTDLRASGSNPGLPNFRFIWIEGSRWLFVISPVGMPTVISIERKDQHTPF